MGDISLSETDGQIGKVFCILWMYSFVIEFREENPVSEEEATEFLYSASPDSLGLLGDMVIGDGESECVALFIHGFTGTNLENLYLANKLARQGIRSYLVLLPGHGQDYEALRRTSGRDWIGKAKDALVQVRSAHPDSKLFLVGHSLGGPIAVNALLDSGVEIDGLVLLASPFHYSFLQRLRVQLFRRFPIKIPFSGFRFSDKKLYQNSLVDHFDGSCKYIYMKSAGDAFDVMSWAYRKLSRLRVPVLLVYSKIDYRVPLSQAYLFRRFVPDAELQVFDRGNHVLHIDMDREEISEAVLGWMVKRGGCR